MRLLFGAQIRIRGTADLAQTTNVEPLPPLPHQHPYSPAGGGVLLAPIAHGSQVVALLRPGGSASALRPDGSTPVLLSPGGSAPALLSPGGSTAVPPGGQRAVLQPFNGVNPADIGVLRCTATEAAVAGGLLSAAVWAKLERESVVEACGFHGPLSASLSRVLTSNATLLPPGPSWQLWPRGDRTAAALPPIVTKTKSWRRHCGWRQSLLWLLHQAAGAAAEVVVAAAAAAGAAAGAAAAAAALAATPLRPTSGQGVQTTSRARRNSRRSSSLSSQGLFLQPHGLLVLSPTTARAHPPLQRHPHPPVQASLYLNPRCQFLPSLSPTRL